MRGEGGREPDRSRGVDLYPWRCLWRGSFEQITRTTPLRLMTLQLRHIRFTDASTFMSESFLFESAVEPRFRSYFARKTIRPRVRSYGVNSTVTLSPGRMRM